MVKILSADNRKNLIGRRLAELRQQHGLSQRDLAGKLQLAGYNLDKNVITRIETYQRYVSDFEIRALCEIFQISADDLLDMK